MGNLTVIAAAILWCQLGALIDSAYRICARIFALCGPTLHPSLSPVVTGNKALRIAPAGEADLASTAALIRHYATSLPVDLNRQGFAEEISGLPGPYAPPDGTLLLAFNDTAPVGCIALKRLAPGTGEIKRLYVVRESRGLGVGKALVAAILSEAAHMGYREIKLDTLPHMAEAIALYCSFGFQPIAPYGSFPYPGLLCFGRLLT